MATTPLGLPLFALTDSADVAAKLNAISDAVNALLTPLSGGSGGVRADVTKTNVQTVATSTDTTVTGWAGTTGNGISYSNGVWTIATAGYYVMFGQVAYPNIASPAGQRVGRVLVNGAIVHENTNSKPDPFFNCPCTLVYGGHFAVGDTIAVGTYQSQGTSIAMATTAGMNHFHIRLVSLAG